MQTLGGALRARMQATLSGQGGVQDSLCHQGAGGSNFDRRSWLPFQEICLYHVLQMFRYPPTHSPQGPMDISNSVGTIGLYHFVCYPPTICTGQFCFGNPYGTMFESAFDFGTLSMDSFVLPPRFWPSQFVLLDTYLLPGFTTTTTTPPCGGDLEPLRNGYLHLRP